MRIEAPAIWQPFLDRAGVVILDGGLATELERRGADISHRLWSAKLLIDNPDLIRQVHEDYFRAGADVGISASYQASFHGFLASGLDSQQAAELMWRSVRLVQHARDNVWAETEAQGRQRPLVAASIGSYGAFLHDGSEYRGDYGLSVNELMDWHRPRLAILAASGADVLACETIPCVEEAEALARLLDELPPIPAWISFSCRDERRLCIGVPLLDAIDVVQATGKFVAVGVNCTPPHLVEGLLQSVQEHTSLPLVAYPNSGERWNAAWQRWDAGETLLDWGEAAQRWQAAGARLIGGCCRTTPATIRQIASSVRRSSRA